MAAVAVALSGGLLVQVLLLHWVPFLGPCLAVLQQLFPVPPSAPFRVPR